MIKLKPFRQTPGYCGPASLKMVLDFYGFKMGEKELAKLSGMTLNEGVSAEGLKKAAQNLGFSVFIKENAELSDIRFYIKKGIPVIVDWFCEDDGHYSVVVGIDKNKITLMDPQLRKVFIFVRRRVMQVKTFFRVWFDFPGDYIESSKDIILRMMIVVTPKKDAAQ
jgi:predicted double-glycine peptidase